MAQKQIYYSDKYTDDQYEYRFAVIFACNGFAKTRHGHVTFLELEHCRKAYFVTIFAREGPPPFLKPQNIVFRIR